MRLDRDGPEVWRVSIEPGGQGFVVDDLAAGDDGSVFLSLSRWYDSIGGVGRSRALAVRIGPAGELRWVREVLERSFHRSSLSLDGEGNLYVTASWGGATVRLDGAGTETWRSAAGGADVLALADGIHLLDFEINQFDDWIPVLHKIDLAGAPLWSRDLGSSGVPYWIPQPAGQIVRAPDGAILALAADGDEYLVAGFGPEGSPYLRSGYREA